MTREDCLARDATDPLAPLRALFDLPPDVIYLDGNSLGPLPRATPAHLDAVLRGQWGCGLIGSWNSAGWMQQPQRIGDRIAALIGAGAGEVVAADSTSVNLHKVLAAALSIAAEDAPRRRTILSERDNFPTDLHIAETLAQARGFDLMLCDEADIGAHLRDGPAVLLLTHVNYRTGHMHDMAVITRAARAAGALVIWDLAHSAGAVPVDLIAAGADFAVGCGYKFLNGGPGAPAFLWVAPRHIARARQPLTGWIGHAAPFDFSPDYIPAPGIARFLCGTPPVLGLAALDCGLDTLLAAEPLGGMAALRQKSLAQTRLFMELVETRCAGHGFTIATPREDHRRGSQVSLQRAEGGYAIVQALIARGVVGDFRAPDILRFGITPLITRYVDLWDAADHLAQVLDTAEWRQPRFAHQSGVT